MFSHKIVRINILCVAVNGIIKRMRLLCWSRTSSRLTHMNTPAHAFYS